MMNDDISQANNMPPPPTADEASWQDLDRIKAFVGVLGFGFVVSSIYLVFFLLYLFNKIPIEGLFGNKVIIIAGVIIILIIPLIVEFIGLRIIFGVTEEYVKSFYNMSDEINVSRLIRLRVLGIPPVPKFLAMTITYPFILVTGDKLDDKSSWAYSVGGPAKLIIYDGRAVYLERGGKFSRVVGSGIAFLERYETIREIIDLRPQIKELSIDCWTKDGISMKIFVRLECQILSAKDAESSRVELSQESEKRIYPLHEKSVQAAVETASVAVWLDKDGKPKKELEKYDWVAGVCGNMEGHIRMHVYGNTINRLLRGETSSQTRPETAKRQFQEMDDERPVTQLLSTELQELIQGKVNKDVERLGARLINLQILKVEKDSRIDSQWKENWRAEWENLNSITAGEAGAYKIRTLEKAHAEAQKDMILAIAESLEDLDKQEMLKTLLLSLSGMLENSLVDPYVRAALPRETLETLEKLQDYLK